MLAVSTQLALEDEEIEDMSPIYAAAAISNYHDDEDGIDDLKYYQAAIQSPLAEKSDTSMKEELDTSGQHQIFGDSWSFSKGEKLCQVTGYTKSSVMEQAMCSSSRPGWSVEEITKSKLSTTRLCMHRVLARATFGWYSPSPPIRISRYITWMYAWLSLESPWRQRSIYTCRRDVFIWSKLGAIKTIEVYQRLRGR
jgi:hypothetical protein